MPGAAAPLLPARAGKVMLRSTRTMQVMAVLACAVVLAVAGVFSFHGQVSMLSVAQVEREQQLQHQMSRRIADQELDHFAQLNQELFAPSKPEPHVNVHKNMVHRTVAAQNVMPAHAAHEAKVVDQKDPARQPSAVNKADFNQQKTGATKAVKIPSHAQTAKAVKSAAPVQSALKDAKAVKNLGNDVIDVPTHENVHFDDGDVHVPGDAVNQYMFKHKPQNRKDPSPKLSRSPKSPVHDKARLQVKIATKKAEQVEAPMVHLSQHKMAIPADEIFDVPAVGAKGGFDDGDVLVPGNALNEYMFRQMNPSGLRPVVNSQKLEWSNGFLGEGPWVNLPVAGQMSGAGVGANFDYAHGVKAKGELSPDPSSKKPCTYKCSDPNGCAGHPDLSDGDCEETFGRDFDIERPSHPTTYDPWSGNTNSLFRQVRGGTLLSARPSPMMRQRAILTSPRRLPGLGSLAPPVALQALRRYQTARGKLMMQRQRAIQALRSPLEHFTELSHAPTCLGNGSICGDEVIDLPDHMVGENQGDVVFPAEQIVPYMYRGNTYQLRNMMGNVVYGAYQPGYAPYGQFAKAPTTMLAQKNLGDEEMFGNDERVDVSKVTSENSWATAINSGHRRARPVKLRTSNELKQAQKKATLQSKFQQAVASGIIRDKKRAENDVDGLLDDVVKVGEDFAQRTPRWNKFFSPPDQPKMHTSNMPILASNHSLGDETVDTMDQVNIDSNNTHSGKDGELNWENYFSNKQQAGSKVAARAGQQQERFYQKGTGVYTGMSGSAARQDIDSYWKQLNAAEGIEKK